MRDLFALDVDMSTLLPNDDISEGFDNIASALKVSPSFLDQYIMAARAMAKQAVGAPAPDGQTRKQPARPGRGVSLPPGAGPASPERSSRRSKATTRYAPRAMPALFAVDGRMVDTEAGRI